MIRISCNDRNIKANVLLTPSKSITNRALIIRALSGGKTEIINPSASGDSKTLADILDRMPDTIDAGDAGTAFRFLTAYLSICDGPFVLTGNERMMHRPVGELVKSLRNLGAGIEFMDKDGFPPIRINGGNLKGGKIVVDASESSQFISAMLLIAPRLRGGLTIEMKGKIFSRSYVLMTIKIMREFGIKVDFHDNFIAVAEQEYSVGSISVENDWSAASFWYAIAALSAEPEITLLNLSMDSVQGDVVIAELMKIFGVVSTISNGNNILTKKNIVLPKNFEYDFSDCPDLVIPVAVVCAGLSIPARFSGVKNLRIKESDRLRSIREEFEKFGVIVKDEGDEMNIVSFDGKKFNKYFHSHNDHRIVMSLAALALKFDTIVVDNHLDVNKSYPGFWDQLQSAGFHCEVI